MATLDEMREFKAHLDIYSKDLNELGRLCSRAPVDLGGVTDADREAPLSTRPEGAVLDTAFLEEAVLEASLPEHPAVSEDDLSWGWWSEDASWWVLGRISEAEARIDDARALADRRRSERDEAVARSLRLQRFRSSIESYREANSEDEAALSRLQEERDDPEGAYADAARSARERGGLAPGRAIICGAGAAGVVVACALPVPLEARAAAAVVWAALAGVAWARLAGVPASLWQRGRWLSEFSTRVGMRIEEAERRVDARRTEMGRLEEKSAIYRKSIEAPFERGIEEADEGVRQAEGALVAVYEADLARRDPDFEEGSLSGLPFEEAVREGNRRLWALFGAWMDSYRANLPAALEHAERERSSELVWLEGHAPFGKRYWPLVDDVISVMEQVGIGDSDVALKRVLDAR